MSRLRNSTSGFTLTELVITLFILGMAFSTFVTIFLTIDGVSDRTLDLVRANDAAFTKMQEYENLDYMDITVGAGPDYEVEDFTSTLPEGLRNPTGTVHVQYEGASLTLKRIEVRVVYDAGKSTERKIEYANLIHISGVGR